MNGYLDGDRELVVTILLRAIPKGTTDGEVGIDVYKAVVQALSAKYAIVGYSWNN